MRAPLRFLMALPDQFGHLAVRIHRFDQHNVAGIESHPPGPEQVVLPLHQDGLCFLGLGIGHLLEEKYLLEVKGFVMNQSADSLRKPVF